MVLGKTSQLPKSLKAEDKDQLISKYKCYMFI